MMRSAARRSVAPDLRYLRRQPFNTLAHAAAGQVAQARRGDP
jgi:hypothetical protein